MDPTENFVAFFNERLRDRELSLKQLSNLSGISMQHLEALRDGSFKQLPPAPYLRGYILKLGDILDFDYDLWWKEILNEQSVAHSGPGDTLPSSKLSHPWMRSLIGIGIVILAIGLYTGIRYTKILGLPELVVIFPRETITYTQEERVRIHGTIDNADILRINNEHIVFSNGIPWEKEYFLSPGLNAIEIYAEKNLGREVRIIRQFFYEQPPQEVIDNSSIEE